MKNKGFTLIELLAVIVILAIIALIAVPIVIGIINDAKKESNERSIELYGSAVEQAVARYQLNTKQGISGTFTQSNDGKTLTTGATTLTVDYDGDVECETIQIKEDGTIYLANCKVDDVLIEGYTYGTSSEGGTSTGKPCTLTDNDGDGEASLSDIITCGSSESFYVMSTDNTNKTVTMLAQYNLDLTNNIQSETNAGKVQFSSDIYWIDSTSNKLKSEYTNFVYDNNSNLYTHVSAYETYLREELKVSSASTTLINEEQLTILGCDLTNFTFTCKTEENSPLAWVYSTSYWTGHAWFGGNQIAKVSAGGVFGPDPHTSNYGVRPVVTISTDEL